MENDFSNGTNQKVYYLPNLDNTDRHLVDGIFTLGSQVRADLSKFNVGSFEEFKKRLLELNSKYNETSEGTIKFTINGIRGLWLFSNAIKNGDLVFTIYNNRIYFGLIESEYFYLPADGDSGHKRLVEWYPGSIDNVQELKNNPHFRFNKKYVTDHTETQAGYVILRLFNKLFPKSKPGTRITLIYGTNRKLCNNKFIGEIDNQGLNTGQVSVEIPFRKNPEINNRWMEEIKEYRSRNSKAGPHHLLNQEKINEVVCGKIPSNKKEDLLLFIHGYNTSFDEAACRTAELAYNIKFNGLAGFFSWPSNKQVLKYFEDKENNDNSIDAFCSYMDNLLSKDCYENVYLVAHSMGCRLLFNAICKCKKQQKSKFHVLLAAADISQKYFNDNIKAVVWSNCQKMTSYVSSNDRALMLSKAIRFNKSGTVRIGSSPKDISHHNQLDKIDGTNNTSTGIFSLNHSYIFTSIEILNDLFSYTRNHIYNPSDRLLFPTNTLPIDYWSFKP